MNEQVHIIHYWFCLKLFRMGAISVDSADAAFWSRSTLFVQACLSEYEGQTQWHWFISWLLKLSVCILLSMFFIWTIFRTKTGCTCSFNRTRSDCACCDVDACQCPESNRFQCVQCGRTENCGKRKFIVGRFLSYSFYSPQLKKLNRCILLLFCSSTRPYVHYIVRQFSLCTQGISHKKVFQLCLCCWHSYWDRGVDHPAPRL